ncbi:unnamed protein product [Blepharisma stoltei]|uniref:Uncharacterized protein n=1 Tax=Blepharisma stoltei TaxID=1481888 RepID=A0AAU9IVQ7_9CILI|nr:unnamed protein product [Blepharisma stoltei]
MECLEILDDKPQSQSEAAETSIIEISDANLMHSSWEELYKTVIKQNRRMKELTSIITKKDKILSLVETDKELFKKMYNKEKWKNEINTSIRTYIETLCDYATSKLKHKYSISSKIGDVFEFRDYLETQGLSSKRRDKIIVEAIKNFNINLDEWKRVRTIKNELNDAFHKEALTGRRAEECLEFLPEKYERDRDLIEKLVKFYEMTKGIKGEGRMRKLRKSGKRRSRESKKRKKDSEEEVNNIDPASMVFNKEENSLG